MIRRQEGGAAVQVLAVALMLVLLVAGMGLTEAVRAATVKSRAARALTAAVQSAARTDLQDPDAARQTFHRVLRANLSAFPAYEAHLLTLPEGGHDPLTGRRFDRPAVSGKLTVTHRLEYMERWLPAVRLRLTHAELGWKRKPGR